MVTMERMTAGAIGRGGIAGGRLTLLVRDALAGRARSRRALELAMGAELSVVLRSDPSHCPLEFVDAQRRRYGIVTGVVDLAPGMKWDDDTLYAQMPETLSQAVVGRRLDEVLGHPDVDPEAVTRPPRHDGGLVSVDRMTVELPDPTLRERLGHPLYRLRLLVAEGRMDVTAPTWVLAGQATIIGALVLAIALRMPSRETSTVSLCVTGFMITALLHGLWNIHNLSRRRPFSMLHAMMASTRHEGMLAKIRTEGRRA